MQGKRRYALIGTGNRGTTMWGKELLDGWSDQVDLVAIVDTNPLRAERARAMIGSRRADPDRPRRDARGAPPRPRHRLHPRRHPRRHRRAGARGRRRRHHREADDDHRREDRPHPRGGAPHRPPRRRLVQLPLRPDRRSHQGAAARRRDRRGAVGRLPLVSRHQARRRLLPPLARLPRPLRQPLRPQGDAPLRPAELVSRLRPRGGLGLRRTLKVYGRNGPFRSVRCKGCPHAAECHFYLDIAADPFLDALYEDPKAIDGYLRDACVFREDIDIPDTMVAAIRYANGAQVSYSLNTSMPIEGHHIAFNGTLGRIELRQYEKQPWETPGPRRDPARPQLPRRGNRRSSASPSRTSPAATTAATTGCATCCSSPASPTVSASAPAPGPARCRSSAALPRCAARTRARSVRLSELAGPIEVPEAFA